MRAVYRGVALAVIAAAAAGAQEPPKASGGQELFDSALALEAKGDHAGALAVWEALEAKAAKNRRTVAIARLHEGAMLLALDRSDEAVVAARAGLADLPASDPTLQGDRYRGNLTLGRVAEDTLDYASAVDSYRTAVSLATGPVYKLGALRGLIATETFVDAEAAAADFAAANALLATVAADKTSEAIFLRLGAELALNRKDYAGARAGADAAIHKLGGLTTTRVDLNDVAARSDYALASMLLGKTDDARRYMAYTGAGRLPKGQFDPAAEMKAPDCGGDAGLRPDDVAVVEFSIKADGSVLLATPIWSAGGGAAALEFARAVRRWSFSPEKVKAMPEFFRYRARVEMRCSTGFERPSLGAFFDVQLRRWLDEHKIATVRAAGVSDAAAAGRLRAQLAATEADTLASVPVIAALIDNSVVPREECARPPRAGDTRQEWRDAAGAARDRAQGVGNEQRAPLGRHVRARRAGCGGYALLPGRPANPRRRAAARSGRAEAGVRTGGGVAACSGGRDRAARQPPAARRGADPDRLDREQPRQCRGGARRVPAHRIVGQPVRAARRAAESGTHEHLVRRFPAGSDAVGLRGVGGRAI